MNSIFVIFIQSKGCSEILKSTAVAVLDLFKRYLQTTLTATCIGLLRENKIEYITMVATLFVQSTSSTSASFKPLVTQCNFIFTVVMVFSLSLNSVSCTCPPTSDEELHDLLMRQYPIASHESSWNIPSWQSYIQHHLNQSSGDPEPVSGYDMNCNDALHRVPEARTHERWVSLALRSNLTITVWRGEYCRPLYLKLLYSNYNSVNFVNFPIN